MKLFISDFHAWQADVQEEVSSNVATSTASTWPNVDFVPRMSRRRLSPFAKIALHVMDKTLSAQKVHCPIVFSSRFGDLHRTSQILEDVANEEPLSPTAFGLSVHNAVPSLHSILVGNTQAINAIAAGKDSFFMALLDAYARLKTTDDKKVLLVHVDQELPAVYEQFKDEIQVSHGLSMLLSLEQQESEDIALNFQSDPCVKKSSVHSLQHPAALNFVHWMNSDALEFNYNSDKYIWNLVKDV